MARVLFFADGTLPDDKMWNFGADMRLIQVHRMLLDAGHEVVVSANVRKYQVAGRLAEVPAEVQALSHTLHPMPEIFARARPDVVYFAAFVPYPESWVPPVPTVVEMGGPTLLEMAFSEGVIGADLMGFLMGELNALAKADLVVVFGVRQQWYYRMPLALAGFPVDRPPPVAVVHHAVVPAIIEPREMAPEPRFVYSGGLYPWTDPCDAIVGVLDAIDRRQRGEFHFIGGLVRELPAVRAMLERIEPRMAASQRAHRHPFMPFPALVARLRTMSVAIELMRPNCERDLALPFRTPLSLACGLPVICGDFMELAPAIREYDAGWVGPADRLEWFEAAIEEAMDDPQALARKSANAQRLARERLSCDVVGADLLAFLKEPKRRETPLRQLDRQDYFMWWSPAEKRLLLRLRHPWLRPLRSLAGRIFGRS